MDGPCSVDFVGRPSAASGHKRIGLLDEDLIRRGWFIGSSGAASQEGFERAAGRTADPSTSLRFGRDDKGRGVTQLEWLRDGLSKNLSKKEPPNRRSLH
jgi:hypothetical protein